MRESGWNTSKCSSKCLGKIIRLYLNESLCLYYRILWSESKVLFTIGKIHCLFILNGSIEIRLQEKGPSISITHTADFEKYFPVVDLSAPR